MPRDLASRPASSPIALSGVAADAALKSPDCYYAEFSQIGEIDLLDHLNPHPPPKCDVVVPQIAPQKDIFDGYAWCRWTSENWFIPLTATVLYLLMIAFLKSYMAKREKLRLQPVVVVWNFGLSLFSIGGLYYCVPHLLFNERSGLMTVGFYPSVCSEPASYGYGESGFWVMLFIYSKLAELIDTLWLLLRKSPVILLHWYHHVTVLLYCWHSYSIRIGTGLWFASMNYTVHAIMYFYFGLTQTGPAGRKFAKNFAMLITSMQLLQMVVGIIVTVSSVVYHANGSTCYVSLVNSMLGLAMYSSYFVLFLQLFLNHYVYSKKGGAKKAAPTEFASCPPETMQALAGAADAVNKGKPETKAADAVDKRK